MKMNKNNLQSPIAEPPPGPPTLPEAAVNNNEPMQMDGEGAEGSWLRRWWPARRGNERGGWTVKIVKGEARGLYSRPHQLAALCGAD